LQDSAETNLHDSDWFYTNFFQFISARNNEIIKINLHFPKLL